MFKKRFYSRLKPFPSLAANIVGDCKAMQNVAALEIDPRGWLWVADSGEIYNVIALKQLTIISRPHLYAGDFDKKLNVSKCCLPTFG
jgi:hypothetical protein